MAALTEARDTWYQESVETLRIPMAADAVIYPGGMACVDADGYAVPAADAEDYKFAGVAEDDPRNPGIASYDNTDGDDGDLYVLVRQRGRFRFDCYETPAQDMLFGKAYVSDDQTVAVCAWDVTNDVRCGHVTRLPATTLADDPDADFSTDEIEIQLSGEPFDWTPGTTTAGPTTTAAPA